MRKKILVFLFSAMFLLAGYNGKEAISAPIEKASKNSVQSIEVQKKEIEQQTLEKIEKMSALMDSLLMCMKENNRNYEASNTEFFWTSLYYAIGNYGYKHPLAKINEDKITLPKQVVQEFATGLFAQYNDLLELPEQLINIQYDKGLNAYHFMLGDRGLSAFEMTDKIQNEDGSFDIKARLYDVTNEETICEGNFHLVKNIYADSIAEPIFYYSIEKANITKSREYGRLSKEVNSNSVEISLGDKTNTYQLSDELLNAFKNIKTGKFIKFDVMIDAETGIKQIVKIY